VFFLGVCWGVCFCGFFGWFVFGKRSSKKVGLWGVHNLGGGGGKNKDNCVLFQVEKKAQQGGFFVFGGFFGFFVFHKSLRWGFPWDPKRRAGFFHTPLVVVSQTPFKRTQEGCCWFFFFLFVGFFGVFFLPFGFPNPWGRGIIFFPGFKTKFPVLFFGTFGFVWPKKRK